MTRTERLRQGGIPRGLSRSGPVLFSYGFRPFFLGGAAWALAAMVLWIMALSGHGQPGGDYGAANWHMHEMLFGFASAVLTGFLMTAVPNWTGRMPLSGRPLMVLTALWLLGRLAMTWPPGGALWAGVLADAVFLPVMAAIFAIEIIAGRKWRDLKVVAAVTVLALANLGFHAAVLRGGDPARAARAAIAAYVMLIVIIGGRITPSFTRNWLARRGPGPLPVPYNGFDTLVACSSGLTLAVWILAPESRAVALLGPVAAGLNLARMLRWHGWRTWPEPLVLALHGGYAMLALGFAAIGLSGLGLISTAGTLHVLAVGAIAGEMLAVMGRATRGHTGRALTASPLTSLSYVAIWAAALLRPAAELGDYTLLIHLAGGFWMLAFGLYLLEYAPMLLRARKEPRA
ncbi:short-chain dehydrogenase [Paracoccus limosus]|uniref:Short-chain dehydrogenase n=1 Tax=Paracoccus limosus TaxID=913252 RepID=A0A844H323_9RHOB|nr:NnrS family protein [Paracoccus limosus]MTH34405.1 short-chain dehydrogenase [Paracoccus limosus]